MTETPKPKNPGTFHALHVTAAHGTHLHINTRATDDEVRRVGKAARAFLGDDRQAPSGFAVGFYPFRVDRDGNGYPGRRVDRIEPA